MRPFPGPRVAIVHHGGQGRTARLAQAVARGVASVDGVQSLLIRVANIDPYWDTLERMDAMIFGSPSGTGSVSAPFKAFMDASAGRVLAGGLAWANKLAAGFTGPADRSGDRVATLQQLSAFAAGHGMHWLPAGFRHDGAEVSADQGADAAASTADLREAEMLGARMARAACQLWAGRRASQTRALPLGEPSQAG